MNEFIAQFLVECHELVEQATDDLLALEEEPADRERLDSGFRAFHTLKGAAAIVEFAAMARALHAAEDVLAATRAGARILTAELIGDCLACLDQVVQWLDEIEASGEVPTGADSEADAVVRRLGAAAAPAVAEPGDEDWRRGLLARHSEVASKATVAVRYRPAADSFYRGIDPLAAFEGAPGLLALELIPVGPWPPLESLDPFTCHLTLQALFSGPAPETLRALGAKIETVQGVAGAADRQGGSRPVVDGSGAAAELLRSQMLMLQASASDGLAGRMASAAAVGANVLRAERRAEEAERLLEISRAAADPLVLARAFEQVLAGGLDPVSPEPEAAATTGPAAAARTLRVEVERVDALVNLAGELSIAKNALAHAAALARAGGDVRELAELLKGQHAQLDRLVSQLQRSVLNIRVLPVRHVFQRFPRLVREMGVSLGKPVRLTTEGEGTEADKVIVESLFEPLLHVVRNALDHGVEPADERAAAGKSPSANVTLRAWPEGDRVIVEVQDDGRGVDIAKVRRVAAERGVASAEALAGMDDEAALELVFAPGFSTAQDVSQLSGRGVGMDAVRTAVERLGGRVSLYSEAGAGTRVRFVLPFSVVMSQVLTVEAAGQAFGIPMEAIVETARLPAQSVSMVGAARAVVLRNETMPLIQLGVQLGQADAAGDREELDAVIVTAAGRLAALQVDGLGERLEVMLKPPDGLLAGMPGLSGTTLLGDGRVLLVLDVQELLA